MSRKSKHHRRVGRGSPDPAPPGTAGLRPRAARSGDPRRTEETDHGPGERLQKVLAAAGVGSRRDCEELIREGRVEVDRRKVTELGTRVDPLRHEIRVDGEALRQPKRLYFAVNKPVGVVTTSFDPGHRPRVIDLVPTEERVFAVGRLDRSSEGLILVTNDGEFANRISHPRYGVEKTYLVRVAGAPDQRQLARLKKGVHLAEGFARAHSIARKKRHGQSTDLVIVLSEGRNREIRRILARVGHKVLALKRIAVGPIKLADLPVGGWRRLVPNEVEALIRVARQKRREAKGRRRARQASGFGVQGSGVETPARSASEGDRRVPSDDSQKQHAGKPVESAYLQKQALMAEPLSLDDLLRDDLDEGPLGGFKPDGGSPEEGKDTESIGGGHGGVIDYGEEEFSEQPASAQPQKQLGKMLRRKQRGQRREPAREREPRPRESFGRKRGGKRTFSPQHEGRGAAGDTAGNFRFRPKKKLKQRRGKKSGGPMPAGQGFVKKKFGRAGRKRKGRR